MEQAYSYQNYQQQQQNPQQEYSGYGQLTLPQHNQQDDSISKWELEFELYEELEHILRGEVYSYLDSSRTKRGWVQKLEPLCNDEGINSFFAKIRSHLNRNITLSFLNETQINRIARQVRVNIATIMFLKYPQFDIKYSNFDLILNIIDHNVFCNLCRALNGGEKEYRHKFISESINRNMRQPNQKQKSGFLRKFTPFMGGDQRGQQNQYGGE